MDAKLAAMLGPLRRSLGGPMVGPLLAGIARERAMHAASGRGESTTDLAVGCGGSAIPMDESRDGELDARMAHNIAPRGSIRQRHGYTGRGAAWCPAVGRCPCWSASCTAAPCAAARV
jgi:hypothetical protein